ncbi:putative protein kinase [Neospora caninum Liverpool]|uniref:Protein kinase, putative n=1 Tax=Neospora caninum (strain Liverpool) TaxID=572307 RepID=F0V9F2_NEOCL|nr:putative protein kinase [Neospora caninum Liverpool]CBZ50377.1 putative protein kinase [Neospora caninum Liverpool]CEL64985.1 TPA: protein kinase, putative [Neospora caninum Liverpool]|eukprot:XP_003880411.1 putative protein kinase [Neospora caninum Liverpool]
MHPRYGDFGGKGNTVPASHCAIPDRLSQKSGNPVAVKIYEGFRSMNKDRKAVIVREIRVMRRLSHESIVKYAGIYNEAKALYVLMQFLNGGSLHTLVKNHEHGKLSEETARNLFKQICNAVNHMHARSIVHRDLKLENILLDSTGRIKVIDFGFSSIVKHDARCRMRCGTPSYMPPEILLKKEYDGFAADIWSLGVVLYAMLHGGYPFRGNGLKDLYAKILQGDFPLSMHLSDAAQQLLCGMLTLQPVDRLTIEEILCHPCALYRAKWLSGDSFWAPG